MEKIQKKIYITTTLPYVNAELHMGHALELIRADIIARHFILKGDDVFFNTGTDEHGTKIYNKAKELEIPVEKFVDENVAKFHEAVAQFGITKKIHFVRTTEEKHIKAVTEFWRRVQENGFIYKKSYQTKYCSGCELEKTDSDLVNGKCPDHLNVQIEFIDEENYFFKFSSFEKKLLEFYEKNPSFVVPDFRFNEIKSFVSMGLKDFSISRLKSKMPWGIEVPGDPNHTIYVWFDALTNYISTLGWPEDEDTFNKYWVNGTPIQYCGKDNIRFQAAMWQAMLIAAGLPNSYKIVINGHITGEGGVKMSKSLQNVIDPLSIIKEYGTDALRYYVARHVQLHEDSEFSIEKFKETYNANLANGLGNLVSRIMTLSEKYLNVPIELPENSEFLKDDPTSMLDNYQINNYCDYIWQYIQLADISIQKDEPFKIIKVDEVKGKKLIINLVARLYKISLLLKPILPETSEKIEKLIKENKKPETPLFPRKD